VRPARRDDRTTGRPTARRAHCLPIDDAVRSSSIARAARRRARARARAPGNVEGAPPIIALGDFGGGDRAGVFTLAHDTRDTPPPRVA